jgi:hypothetical protein
MASHDQEYRGKRFGRAARFHSKMEAGVRRSIISLQRLEQLLGQDPNVTEPPPPVRGYRRSRKRAR